MRGVLICGGTGSRLKPLTEITNKSLLPVYDRPLIEYPLKTLLAAGINDIAVITGTEHIDQMEKYLGTGERFGCRFAYRVQEKAGGIAQALGMAEGFAEGESVCAILGDNLFFDDLSPAIRAFQSGAHLFLKSVADPERFGVADIRHNAQGISVVSLQEKPAVPMSDFAVTGCYLYDSRCFEMIRNLKPSARGELEITDVSAAYLERSEVSASILKEEWIDAGTFESLHRAAVLVRERGSAKKMAARKKMEEAKRVSLGTTPRDRSTNL